MCLILPQAACRRTIEAGFTAEESNMKPIEVKITGHVQKSPQEICAAILDTQRWPEFTGYSILPGIESAYFEVKTPEVVGSKIRVRNTDGSSHMEEIMEWDATSKVMLKFQDFSPPLRYLVAHFIKTWELHGTVGGADISRSMAMYPKSRLASFVLIPISRLMKKAFEKNLVQANNR